MPDEMDTNPNPGATAPPPDAPPAAPAQPPVQQFTPPSNEGKNVVIPTSAMKRIKEEEYAKGKQSALEQIARDAGYETHADFVAALARLRSAPPQPTPRQPATPNVNEGEPSPEEVASQAAAQVTQTRAEARAQAAIQRQLEKTMNERNRYAQSASEYRKQLEQARAEADAIRAEMHLRTVAAGVGVQDIDYAIMLLTREVEKLTPEDAEKFDERGFFEGLRKSKPLLFGEAVVPATTGTGTGGAPTPPKPNTVASQTAANGKVDARKMNPQQYAELLRARGINPHAS